MNRIILPIIIAIVISISIPSVYAVVDGKLYGIEGGCCIPFYFDNGTLTPTFTEGFTHIHELNKTATDRLGATISKVDVVISGMTIQGTTGMAVDPTTGIFYIIAKDDLVNATDRKLAIVDPVTGLGSIVGSLGDKFSSIAFLNDGSMRGVIGGGGVDAFGYFAIDKTDASKTKLCTLVVPPSAPSNQAGSVTLNSNTNQMYWFSGFNRVVDTFGVPEVPDPFAVWFSPIDDTCATDFIVVTGFDNLSGNPLDKEFEPIGFTYSAEENLFYAVGFEMKFLKIDLFGAITKIVDPAFDLACCIPPQQGSTQDIKGLEFEQVYDSTSPIITPNESEPITIIQNTVFVPNEHATCIDETDGDLTSTMNPEVQVDTSIRGSQTQDYGCQDTATNQTFETFQFIVKKKSTGGSSSSGTGGTTSSSPSLSSIPTLSFQDSPSQPTTEGRSIADLFASLFDNRISEGITTPVQSQGSSPLGASGDTTQRPNPITVFLQNLFANFFN